MNLVSHHTVLSKRTNRFIGYVMSCVLLLASALMNGYASAQMSAAHDGAMPNALAICTGKGMTYIDEVQYLEFGVIEYLEFEQNTSGDLSHNLSVTGCLMSDCADLSPADYHYPQARIEAVVYQSTVAHRESRAVQTFAYLTSNPRAPPQINSIA